MGTSTSIRTRLIEAFFRHGQRQQARMPVEERLAPQRQGLARIGRLAEQLEGAQRWRMAIEPVDVGGVPATWLRPRRRSPSAPVLLYFHGGAYVSGSPGQGFPYMGELCRRMGAVALCPRYRYAPEHPHPAAVDDAVRSYRWLLDAGHAPAKIALVGESAGGNLVVATLLALRDAGHPLPAAGVANSPWLDLTHSGESHRSNRDRDSMLLMDGISHCAALYAGATPLDAPAVSPLFAELSGLPPLFLCASESELLRDDVSRFEERARAAGVSVEVSFEPDTLHAYPAIVVLPEARREMARTVAFLRRTVGSP